MEIISIIIVNYKSKDFVIECIESIHRFEEDSNYEILVIDNEGDSSLNNDLFLSYDNVFVYKMPYNAGFARANNFGFTKANGAFILYLNPDTLFIETTLQKCMDELRKNADVGVLGCRLLNPDLSVQCSYHDGYKFLKKILWQNLILINCFGVSKYSVKSSSEIAICHGETHNPPWLSGAFIFMRRDDVIISKLAWDEDFFIYWEDVELSFRAREAGFKLLYFKKVSIIHIGGSGVDVSTERYVDLELSKLLLIKKRFGNIYLFAYKNLVRVTLIIELIALKLSKRKTVPEHLNNMAKFYL